MIESSNDSVMPERRLWLSVINQALKDLITLHKKGKPILTSPQGDVIRLTEVQQFFLDERGTFSFICDSLNMDREYLLQNKHLAALLKGGKPEVMQKHLLKIRVPQRC